MFTVGKYENDILAYEIPVDSSSNEPTQRTIVLALDESLTAQYAFEYAKNILLRPNDLVCIVNCMPTNSPPPLEYLDAGQMFLETGNFSEQQKYHEQHSKWLLKEYKKNLNQKCRLFSLVGDNRDEICRAATNLNADLVVVGSRDLTGLHRMFIGSTTDYLLHNLDIPVFVVKPPVNTEITPVLSNSKINKSD
eukprot:NODE_149_length_17312_cov_0.399349.p9 type:complete len:193 gc:universal NODE_149_length_17312_cov_0.399349:3808-3230(-)